MIFLFFRRRCAAVALLPLRSVRWRHGRAQRRARARGERRNGKNAIKLREGKKVFFSFFFPFQLFFFLFSLPFASRRTKQATRHKRKTERKREKERLSFDHAPKVSLQ
jgi:hypothetical protein